MSIEHLRDGRPTRIDLRDLQKVINVLFDHIVETRGVKDVELERVFYWTVPLDEQFDLDRRPSTLHVGSLADDWDFVRGNLDENPLPLAYSLTEVAPLVSAIGAVLGARLAAKGG